MKKLLIVILFMNSLFGASVDSVKYDVNTNEVVLFFDTPVFTDHILLGLFSFSDGENIIQLTGQRHDNPHPLGP